MAKHIPFASPVNDSESWAFKLLKQNLPDDYLLLTNVEIPTHTGQAMEVDALVIGEWGLYVVDVKGYMGVLDVGQHAWTLDGREVDNSLAKASYVARVLAGNLKKRIPVGVYAPWCQGMVFVTGRQGDTIEVNKDNDKLGVYGPTDIVAALTETWGSTSQYQNSLTEAQRQHALDTIGQVALVEKRNRQVQDFDKTECLYRHGGLQIWQAKYSLAGWQSDWLLKILVAAEFDSKAEFRQQGNQLREQLQRLQMLAGCSGVPLCAPLIDDGEQLVLPIRRPAGVPVQILDLSNYDREDCLRALRRAATSLQQIHSKGYSVSNWQDNQVFISDQGDVEFIDIANNLPLHQDLLGFANTFEDLANASAEPMVRLWFARAQQSQAVSLDQLRADLSLLLDSAELGTQSQVNAGSDCNLKRNCHYRFDEKIRQGDLSEIWRATHLAGGFECAVSVYQQAEQNWLQLSDQYRRLKNLFHPNVERFIELGQIPESINSSSPAASESRDQSDSNFPAGTIYLAREWVPGQTLRQLRDKRDQIGLIDANLAGQWFDQLYQALQYLHSFDLHHGGISLRNIVVKDDKATLVNFGLGLDAIGNSAYRAMISPEIWSLQGGAERDYFSLAASFVVALYCGDFPSHLDRKLLETMRAALPDAFMTDARAKVIDASLMR